MTPSAEHFGVARIPGVLPAALAALLLVVVDFSFAAVALARPHWSQTPFKAWLFLGRLIVPFGLGIYLSLRRALTTSGCGYAGALSGLISGMAYLVLFAAIALRYQVAGQRTPWFTAVFIGMSVFAAFATGAGFLAGAAGGKLRLRQVTAT